MVLVSFIGRVAGPIIRRYVRKGAGHIYRGLRIQDKLIDSTYRRTGLYNRGVVRGIQHGLISGQVVGGILNLGLPGDIENGLPQKRKFPQAYPQYKTRGRYQYNRSSRNKYNSSNFCKRCRQSCPCKC